jgi:hypothetical protein
MELSFKCVTCGAMVNFAKSDVRTGNIPKVIYCPKCQPKAGWNPTEKKEAQVFVGEPVIGKGKWERKPKE